MRLALDNGLIVEGPPNVVRSVIQALGVGGLEEFCVIGGEWQHIPSMTEPEIISVILLALFEADHGACKMTPQFWHLVDELKHRPEIGSILERSLTEQDSAVLVGFLARLFDVVG